MKKIVLILAFFTISMCLFGCAEPDYYCGRKIQAHLISVSEPYENIYGMNVVKLIRQSEIDILTLPREEREFSQAIEVFPVEIIPQQYLGRNVDVLTRVEFRLCSRGNCRLEQLPIIRVTEIYIGVIDD